MGHKKKTNKQTTTMPCAYVAVEVEYNDNRDAKDVMEVEVELTKNEEEDEVPIKGCGCEVEGMNDLNQCDVCSSHFACDSCVLQPWAADECLCISCPEDVYAHFGKCIRCDLNTAIFCRYCSTAVGNKEGDNENWLCLACA